MFNFDSLDNSYKLNYIGTIQDNLPNLPTAHHLFYLINNNYAVIKNMIFGIFDYTYT